VNLYKPDENKLNYGFDVHGVLDAKPDVIIALMRALKRAGHEVHIITGSKNGKRIINYLKKYGVFAGIHYTHFFSISSHLISKGVKVRYIKGKPWFNEDIWNKTKGEYCKRNNIALMIDDSDVYGESFKTPYARFFSKT